jgi:hypothetical protein
MIWQPKSYTVPGRTGSATQRPIKILIRDEHPGSYYPELFWVKKTVFKFYDADTDPGAGVFLNQDRGSGIAGCLYRIRSTNLSWLTAGLCQGVLQGAREEGGRRLPIPAHRESYRLQCFRSGFKQVSGSVFGSRRAKMTHKIIKNLEISVV